MCRESAERLECSPLALKVPGSRQFAHDIFQTFSLFTRLSSELHGEGGGSEEEVWYPTSVTVMSEQVDFFL